MSAAAGALAGRGFGAAVGIVRDTHRAVADRVFDALELASGPARLASTPVRIAHDAIAEVVYLATAMIGDVALRGAGLAAAIALADQEGEIAARVALGALNGACGDMLAAENNPLALEMTARVHGAPGPRLVVFVHGLCETEDAWFLYRRQGVVYGDRLRSELGYTPVYLRYNSGLGIDANGALLSTLLSDLVSESPVEVSEIVLVGHSMGGLVARAACVAGAGTVWASLVRHVVTLGTPHRGAPLEQAAALAVRVLSAVPETRAFAEVIEGRAVGIKDLHSGPAERCVEDIDHYFFSAGVTQALDGWLGDLLVQRRSAWDIGPGEPVRFGVDRYRHLSGAHHFDLLGHPAVADQIVRWLGGRTLEAGDPAAGGCENYTV